MPRGVPILKAGRCFVIAEVAQAHDGSLGAAHSYIDAAAKAGADAVKFQTHFADDESSPLEPFRIKFSRQDETRYDYWKRLEFTDDQWEGLARHAEEKRLLFLSSPFSLRAVDLLERIGMRAWKIASGEIVNAPMLDRIASTNKPILFSSGMSGMEEIRWALDRVRAKVPQVAEMQCTTAYPCPPERIGLNMIEIMREAFDCPVGLSDHSGTIFPGLAGATLGIEVLEVHVTFHRGQFGPDVPASVTFEELKTLVDGIRFIELMRATPVDKAKEAESAEQLRSMFMKGLIVTRDVAAGEALTPNDLDARKPQAGVAVARYDEMIGRTLKRSLKQGAFLQDDDLA